MQTSERSCSNSGNSLGDKRSNDSIRFQRNQRNERRIGQKPLDIDLPGTFRAIGGSVVEDPPEEIKHARKQLFVFGAQLADSGRFNAHCFHV